MLTPEQLVANCTSLISLPSVYLEVKRVIDNPESTMADLSRAISLDPAMTATVLKLVNSAFYGMPRKVDTVSRAVGILGMQPLHDLVLAVSVTNTFSKITQQVMNMDIFWAKSFFSGLVARELARKCFLVDSERMFVEGLLRDIGHLLMYEYVGEESERAITESKTTDQPIHLIEQQLIGFDYTQVGQALVEAWNLPKCLGEAIRHQIDPTGTPDHGFEAALLNITYALTECFQSPDQQKHWRPLIHPESWKLTGLEEEAMEVVPLEAGKQLSPMLDLIEETQCQAR